MLLPCFYVAPKYVLNGFFNVPCQWNLSIGFPAWKGMETFKVLKTLDFYFITVKCIHVKDYQFYHLVDFFLKSSEVLYNVFGITQKLGT